MLQIDAHVALKRLDDALRLIAAQQPVVDEDARELVADGTMHEGGGDGGVDTAREGADDPPLPYLLAY
jgi:hypothetical protein